MSNNRDLKKEILNKISKINNNTDLQQLKISELGKKGRISLLMKSLSEMSIEEKKKLGKEYNDLALKYNETPQGWYYVGYINYYIANNDYKKALEYALKSGTHTNGNHMARASALYWVNDQKDTAIKYYKELITKYPEYTLDTLRRSADVWSRAKESKNLILNAFKEVEEFAKN